MKMLMVMRANNKLQTGRLPFMINITDAGCRTLLTTQIAAPLQFFKNTIFDAQPRPMQNMQPACNSRAPHSNTIKETTQRWQQPCLSLALQTPGCIDCTWECGRLHCNCHGCHNATGWQRC
jgi:hypothetical protein